MASTMLHVLKEEESALRLYFNDISDSTPLSREQEVALSTKIRQGDQEARDELVQANLRFVIDVAKNYQNRGLGLSDLICAGNLGLMTAAERFDGDKGYKFISYAVWWIKQSILQSIADHARTVRLPLNKLSLLKDITKTSPNLARAARVSPRSKRSPPRSKLHRRRYWTPCSAPAAFALWTKSSKRVTSAVS